MILVNLLNDKEKSENYFLNKFSDLVCLDISSEIINDVIADFNNVRINLNYLRNLNEAFIKDEIDASIITKEISKIIRNFLNCHDKIIDSFLKLLNYQKGKILKR